MKINLTTAEAEVLEVVLQGQSATVSERAKLGEMPNESRTLFLAMGAVCDSIRGKMAKARTRAARKTTGTATATE